jgi:hypothetical protein
MYLRTWAAGVAVVLLGTSVASAIAGQKSGPETFKATASIKTAGGVAATAPVTVTVDRMMPQPQVDGLIEAFKSGGADALRKALDGVPPTGSVRIGNAAPAVARLALERVTDKGRLLTVVTLDPIVLLGAGVPGAKSTEGYRFGVVDLEVDASGKGAGTLSPAAKIKVHQGAFVVEDYATDLVQLKEVSKVK